MKTTAMVWAVVAAGLAGWPWWGGVGGGGRPMVASGGATRVHVNHTYATQLKVTDLRSWSSDVDFLMVLETLPRAARAGLRDMVEVPVIRRAEITAGGAPTGIPFQVASGARLFAVVPAGVLRSGQRVEVSAYGDTMVDYAGRVAGPDQEILSRGFLAP
ncbi:MAG: hypothetical protein AAF628_23310 [Planctomycetota bacterium]